MAENPEHSFRQHEADVEHGADGERRPEVGWCVVVVTMSMAMMMAVVVVVMMGVRRRDLWAVVVIVGVIVGAHAERAYPEASSDPTLLRRERRLTG
jgi:hypothetical protein